MNKRALVLLACAVGRDGKKQVDLKLLKVAFVLFSSNAVGFHLTAGVDLFQNKSAAALGRCILMGAARWEQLNGSSSTGAARREQLDGSSSMAAALGNRTSMDESQSSTGARDGSLTAAARQSCLDGHTPATTNNNQPARVGALNGPAHPPLAAHNNKIERGSFETRSAIVP